MGRSTRGAPVFDVAVATRSSCLEKPLCSSWLACCCWRFSLARFLEFIGRANNRRRFIAMPCRKIIPRPDQASDALLREAAALVSDLHKSGRWQALFTAEQINGWLAYDMLQNHPHLFPPAISDLRVAIQQDRAQIAFRWTKPAWSAIVFLETQIFLREENVVAMRICKARAGSAAVAVEWIAARLDCRGRRNWLAGRTRTDRRRSGAVDFGRGISARG